jgi:hypothetical protein
MHRVTAQNLSNKNITYQSKLLIHCILACYFRQRIHAWERQFAPRPRRFRQVGLMANIEPFIGAANTLNADLEFPPHVLGDGKELVLMRKQMERARSYLEFGTGGSTLLALNSGVRKITTADSDPAWQERIRRRADAIKPGHGIEFVHCDIGRTREWGAPHGEEAIKRWPLYFVAPWKRCLDRNGLPDLIFVDGRYRLACALYSVLMCLSHVRWSMPRIMFHDFNRENYHPILKYVTVTASENTLAILSPRRWQPLEPIIRDLALAQFDWG